MNASAGTRASNLGLSGSVSNGNSGRRWAALGGRSYNTPGSFENVQTSTNLQSGQRTTVQQSAATRQNQRLRALHAGPDLRLRQAKLAGRLGGLRPRATARTTRTS
ncbi:MAG: hypothetical protein WKG07_45435 [Hymenobacter sp.]